MPSGRKAGTKNLKRPKVLTRKFTKAVADISGDVQQSQSQPQPSTSSIPPVQRPEPSSTREGGVGGKKKAGLFTPPKKRQRRGAAQSAVDAIEKERSFSSKKVGSGNQDEFAQATRRRTPKLRFPPRRQLTTSETRNISSDEEIDLDKPGIKESLEICQGLSKIKIEDWYPFYDFEYHKRNTDSRDAAKETTEEASKNEGEDDEWEETLVYVDLEDIPDVDGLFSSLAPRAAKSQVEGSLSHLEMKIFDMDSKLPVIQLGGKYLAGHWEDTVGTSLFFKKKSEADGESSSMPHSSQNQSQDSEVLKSIVPEPEIPHDPLFGENYSNGEDGYDLVGKSFKVLKARYYPVVTHVIKKEDVIQDSDEEYEYPRDFQIPPLSMVREHMTSKDFNFEDYIKEDAKRRAKIHKKWPKETEKKSEQTEQPVIKTEPVEPEYDYDSDEIMLLSNENEKSIEPIPSTSRSMNA